MKINSTSPSLTADQTDFTEPGNVTPPDGAIRDTPKIEASRLKTNLKNQPNHSALPIIAFAAIALVS
jgi:hypothetical protein